MFSVHPTTRFWKQHQPVTVCSQGYAAGTGLCFLCFLLLEWISCSVRHRDEQVCDHHALSEHVVFIMFVWLWWSSNVWLTLAFTHCCVVGGEDTYFWVCVVIELKWQHTVFSLFICGGPCHLSSSTQSSWHLLFLWEQPVHSVMEEDKYFLTS